MISWSAKRRLSILGILITFFAVISVFVWFFFVRSPASCSDGVKNENELGVDCGGACKAVCKEEAVPLTTIWSKVFPVRQGLVSAAALIENPNGRFSLPKLAYNFRIYDKDNVVITERKGVTFANANERFLILEPNISVGERVPMRAFIELSPPDWNRLPHAAVQIPVTIQQQVLGAGDTPTLSARIDNNGLSTLYDLTVLALVVDKDDNAVGVSSTFVNSLAAGATSDLMFTWPQAFINEGVAASLFPRIDRTH